MNRCWDCNFWSYFRTDPWVFSVCSLGARSHHFVLFLFPSLTLFCGGVVLLGSSSNLRLKALSTQKFFFSEGGGGMDVVILYFAPEDDDVLHVEQIGGE